MFVSMRRRVLSPAFPFIRTRVTGTSHSDQFHTIKGNTHCGVQAVSTIVAISRIWFVNPCHDIVAYVGQLVHIFCIALLVSVKGPGQCPQRNVVMADDIIIGWKRDY